MSGSRGILGLKKNPKKPMLFICMYNGEEWPSSDSDDTDYEPGKTFRDPDESDDSLTDDPSTSKQPSTRSASRDKNSNNNNAHSSKRPSRKRSGPQKSSKAKIRKLTTASDRSTRAASSQKAGKVPGTSSSCETLETSDVPVCRLPTELWTKIFQFVVGTDGAVPHLCRAARVCREWRDIVRVPFLWHKVDLSYGWIKSRDQTLVYLVHNHLSQCKEINLCGWKNITNDAVRELCENCPHLEMVNLSYCSKLSSLSVSALATGCPKLRHLDLSFTSMDAVGVKSLKLLMDRVGVSLRELVLAGNILTGFNHALKNIMMKCHHLDTLDLSNCKFTSEYLVLNVEKLQENCPSLRVLRLANCYPVRSNQDSLRCQGPGFLKLEELSCASTTALHRTPNLFDGGVTDSLLFRLLHNAQSLRLLDLRGCTTFNPRKSFLPDSPSPIMALEQLYLSQSSISRCFDCLAPALRQWSQSLRVLDLSWTNPPAEDMTLAIEALTDLPCCPLTHLNLAGSAATSPCVILALKKLEKLESLDLSSCRSLPRGIKSLHIGVRALNKLRSQLLADDSLSDTDSY